MRLKTFTIAAAAVALLIPHRDAQASPQQAESNCITCHTALLGADATEGPVHDLAGSAHQEAGLSCVDCHGGNPVPPADLENFDYTAAKGPGTGFRGAPSRKEVPAFCGRCHSDATYMRRFAPQQRIDQERQYAISGHGRALREGNTKVATCVDCHGSHGILPASDPRSRVADQRVPETCGTCHSDAAVMEGSGFSPGIVDDYKMGVHGQALLEQGDTGAPACNDCHGNHGAAPPGLSSVSAVCAQCHIQNAALFRASPHGAAFEMLGEAACEACHGNHDIEPTSDAMLAEDGVCSNCHGGDTGSEVAAGILDELTTLRGHLQAATTMLDDAHRKGIIVDDGRLALRQAENALVRARVAVHTFSREGVAEVVDPAIETATEAERLGEAALAEFDTRRGGWSVFLLLSALAVITLVLLIKRVEGPGGRFPLREPHGDSEG